jgi:hypothetical protein
MMEDGASSARSADSSETTRKQMRLAKLLPVGVGCGGGAGVDSAAAAVFINAPEEILEFGSLLGSKDLADLVVALFANLLELRIHLVVDDVVAMLHIRQYLPDLFLLGGREVELGGQVGDPSRRIWPWLQKGRRLRLSLSAGTKDAPIGDRMSDGTDRHSQNKYQRNQRQGPAIIGTKLH